MEKEIVHNALEHLRQTTGIKAIWKEAGPLEGLLEMALNNQKITFVAEVKNEVRPHQVHQMERYHHEHDHFILIANQIFPKVKEDLRLKEIAYLEANGNIFLKKDNTFLFVDTQKPIETGKEKGNRAFTKTGLKVLFYLLQHKEDINLTQRELAKKTAVGLGNIPQVIEGLKETGYLIPLHKREYIWENRRELLERWVTEYGTVLRPKLRKGRYTYQGNWRELLLNHELTVWGGEPAADMLTNYLRPEKFVLYTRENRTHLMKNYRLIPKPEGEIEVLEIFWRQDTTHKTAPPILVYADLLLEGGKRNIETAEKILNEYIEPIL